MRKVAATYLNRSRKSAPTRTKSSVKRAGAKAPNWFVLVVVVSIGFMLCLAINLRAYSEMSEGSDLNTELNSEVEKLSVENLTLQEEIHSLKSDSKAIEREARKIGMSRPNEKILVPAN